MGQSHGTSPNCICLHEPCYDLEWPLGVLDDHYATRKSCKGAAVFHTKAVPKSEFPRSACRRPWSKLRLLQCISHHTAYGQRLWTHVLLLLHRKRTAGRSEERRMSVVQLQDR